MRIKEIYNYRRVKIPFLVDVHEGEEMKLSFRLYCKREEIPKLIKLITEAQ